MKAPEHAESGWVEARDRQRFDDRDSIRRTAASAPYVRAKLYQVETAREALPDYEHVFQILRGVRYNPCICLVHEGEEEACAAIARGVPILRRSLREYST